MAMAEKEIWLMNVLKINIFHNLQVAIVTVRIPPHNIQACKLNDLMMRPEIIVRGFNHKLQKECPLYISQNENKIRLPVL